MMAGPMTDGRAAVGGGYDQYAFVADLYDHVSVHRDRPDVAFYVDEATRSGGPVLEVGCGSGRILLPTARAGVDAFGIDLSPHMLAVCRERLRAEDAAVRARVALMQADMRDFSLGRTFRLATIPFRAFQHLTTVADQIACLDAVRHHLADGGQLVMDVFNPSLEALVNRPIGEVFAEEPAFTTPDGRRVVRRHRIVEHDRVAQVNHVELLYDVTHPDGREERLVHAFRMRYLFRYELEHLLARCGFALEQLYGGFDRTAVGARPLGELIAVARRA
jgi:SAM-dependent methyltransferase